METSFSILTLAIFKPRLSALGAFATKGDFFSKLLLPIQVYEAFCKANNEKVAVKVVNLEQVSSDNLVRIRPFLELISSSKLAEIDRKGVNPGSNFVS